MKSFIMMPSANKLILVFLYIYPLFFNGISLSSRVALGLLGILSYVVRWRSKTNFYRVIFGGLLIVFVSVVTALYNETNDFQFVSYLFSIVIICFAAYLLAITFKKIILCEDYISAILRIFVYTVLIQSIIACLFYISPTLYLTIISIFPNTAFYEDDGAFIGFRLIGLGSAFFGAGVINGLALITIVYLYIYSNIKNTLSWALFYMFILITGIMMARTTIIGCAISVFYLLSCKSDTNKRLYKRKSKLLIALVAVVVITLIYAFQYLDEKLLNFGFELFYNYDKTGQFESASTNQLQSMYVFPEDIKTWIIGDGRYYMEDGHYYMSTDVGYLRLLYYGGLPMVFAFYYFSWYIIKQIKKLNGVASLSRFLLFTFIYLLVLGLKGLADLNFFYLLIYMCICVHIRFNVSNKHTSYLTQTI